MSELVLAGVVINGTAAENPYPNESSNFYDRFRNRLMIPIHRADSQVIGFGARVLEAPDPSRTKPPGAKYLNSPETLVFKKRSVLVS